MSFLTVSYNEGGLETQGLDVFPTDGIITDATISGLSLVTFGFLWDERDIYTNCEDAVTLTYIDCTC
jgi:hypothetical protein